MTLTVVAGEMDPASDLAVGACGSALWAELITGLPARGGTALLVGANRPDLAKLLASRFGDVTVLVRSLPDAQELDRLINADALDNVSIVAGSMDAWQAQNPHVYDALIAIDGLDRTMSPDRPDAGWLDRLGWLTDQLRPGACVLLALTNQFSLGNTLDARTSVTRFGNDEWYPQQSERTRPTAIPEFLEFLAHREIPVGRLFAGYGDHCSPGALVDVVALNKLRADESLAAVLGHAIADVNRPWLADPRPAWTNAVRAREADTVADFWLLTSGDWALSSYYFAVPGLQEVEDGPTAQSVLLRLAEVGDVPAIRAYAARLGDWARGGIEVQRFDQLVDTGTGFVPGFGSRRATGIETQVAFAALWFGLRDLLLSGQHRNPWPSWMLHDGLVESWLTASGWPIVGVDLAAAAQLAKDWAAPIVQSVTGEREAIVIAQNEAAALRGELQSLREVVEFRDEQIAELHRDYSQEVAGLKRRLGNCQNVRRLVSNALGKFKRGGRS